MSEARPDVALCERALAEAEAKHAALRAQQAESAALTDADRRVKIFRDVLEELKKPVKGAAAAAAAAAGAAAPAAAGASASASASASGKRPAAVHERRAFENVTPKGEKKDVSGEMAKGFEPQLVEQAWDAWWDAQGFFQPTNHADRKNFVMVIPPPNVTGSLHLGHALTSAVEDCLCRYHRMLGENVLWVPGTDHAGIATQSVVEKKVYRERGITSRDLGREAFLAEVWKWKEEKGHHILEQERRIGASVDWTRYAFTMDEPRSRAVTEAFVRMFKDGVIYRANRIVNWCCKLTTALSEAEVDYITIEKPTRLSVPNHGNKKYDFGLLWDFAYKVVGSETGEEIVISTTRPETLLGDTAVAVHPADARYAHLHGRKVWHPYRECELPIVLDAQLVDMTFGTGAVKITPAHDPNDFEVGKRHNLPSVNVFNDDGTINGNAGTQFANMRRFDCRDALVADMEKRGLARGTRPNPMRIGVCQRSNDIIEPMLKPQWYVRMDDMARRAADAVRSGELTIIPEHHKATWFSFLDQPKDWCVSRQLWWGHRIPAYQYWRRGTARPAGEDMSTWVSERSIDEARAEAARRLQCDASEVELFHDEDVLDTWFSSGLFPFSVMGWPDNTDDLRRFYPIDVMETGHDILFFWVARMVMMGLHLTNQLPFKTVFLHAMVRDAHGRKMSKSLGNVVDPVWVMEGITLPELHATLFGGNLDPGEIVKAIKGQREDYPNGIGECGADALRFALCSYTSQGANVNLDVERVVGYRHFVNKMWNATRFALENLKGFVPAAKEGPTGDETPIMQWILSRMSAAAAAAKAGFDKYDFSMVTTAGYNFWLYELCDVYLESMKPIMASGDAVRRRAAQETLYTCLDNGLRLLHPFMPFITEELFQRLPRRSGDAVPSVVVASYPLQRADYDNPAVEAEATLVLDIIRIMRSQRAAYNVQKSARHFFVCSDAVRSVIDRFRGEILTLAWAEDIQCASEKAAFGDDLRHCAVAVVNAECEEYMFLRGVIDPKREIDKLEKEKDKLEKQSAGILKRRGDADKYARVPAEAQAKDSATLEENTARLRAIDESLTQFRAML